MIGWTREFKGNQSTRPLRGDGTLEVTPAKKFHRIDLKSVPLHQEGRDQNLEDLPTLTEVTFLSDLALEDQDLGTELELRMIKLIT